MSERDEELKSIYGAAGSPEPPASLDDSILAASRRAVHSKPAAPRRTQRWGAPVALAATVLLATGVSLMVMQQQPERDAAPAAATDMAPVSKIEQKVARDQAAADARRAEPRKRVEAPAEQAAPAGEVAQAPARSDEGLAASSTVAPAAAPAAPPPRLAESAPAAPQELRRESAEAAKAPARPAAAPLAAARSSAAGRAALADQASVTDEVRQSPEKWLQVMRDMRLEGRLAEADRELAEFRKRYPEHRLPEDFVRP
jgi:hypothetical protein